MTIDKIGDSLRKYYKIFGMENEGPSVNFNVSEFLPDALNEQDIKLIERICNNQDSVSKHKECQYLLESVASLLGDSSFMNEVDNSIITSTESESEHLTNGIFWHYLASILDPKMEKENGIKITIPGKLPLINEQLLKVQGSLIFRLYISLVYMKEGPLNKIIKKSVINSKPISHFCFKLLNCDYVRHIRNALAHSTFESTGFGIYFNDYGKFETVASPEFLNSLTTWIMLLNLQCSVVIDRKRKII